jgi:hypothetical protein
MAVAYARVTYLCAERDETFLATLREQDER